MGLIEDLGTGDVGVDTAIFIYYDRRLPSIPGLRIVELSSYVAS